ncbi:iron-siderophore ABC transporter substrate-binding protein [Candidatus Mycobacterium wuenschmannii]|uniref:Iron-siderophore ABC transporter substrate-binding protein n=1 Tax=Candidatus Mycobacterium wuenschmannii TaxID=3027808 RepID=A0ABY8VYY0_9MYCO|nr:iron-siderophore ABC transporter substrate-binding protein [Candidatus Mycobacterium wuenschmannii]WIM88131.1 iron-siderophore ABC transporter substrate-binding protein [Candidatus Mycobacterium wuenschmannii]
MLLRGVRPALAAIAAATAICSGCSSHSSEGGGAPSASVITSTTQIAGAGVLGNQRRPDESCAPEPAGPDAGPTPRIAHNAAGVQPDTAEVPDDPQRIVVLSGDQLDTLCALGLQSRIVGAALPDGSADQPSYLGTVVHKVPGVGTRGNPDVGAIKAAKPDLILGSQALTPKLYRELAAIAPTVFTGAPGAAWQDNLRGVGEATSRAGAAGDLVEHFTTRAHDDGAAHDAAHYQAAVVQFTASAVRVYGADNFPGSVLTAVGVDRPAAQRFTDKPYIEMGSTDNDLTGSANFSAADADVIYVSFDSPQAKDRAPTIFDSDAWHRLSAARDNRVFVVNNEVWQTGQGVIAARGIVDDLRWLNAPIN